MSNNPPKRKRTYHYHKCPKKSCGHIWRHTAIRMDDRNAHKCPKCGRVQWDKYHYPHHAR